jgi:predicted component of type VI protein secretion system
MGAFVRAGRHNKLGTLFRAFAGQPLLAFEADVRAQLLPLDGSSAIEIAKDLLVVGRREDCDLRLEHKSVSKIHCVIIKTDGLLMLRDLGSTNGTRVNGTRVRRAALLPNDQLNIAGYKFRIYLGPDGPVPKVQSVQISENTQHLNAKEVAELLRKANAAAGEDEVDDSEESPVVEPVHRNQLPDVYPEDRPAGI